MLDFFFQILPPATERAPIPTPCDPSPCGPNAECRESNGAGACFCFNGYEGNPFDSQRGCRRECETNNDCPSNLACVRNKCIDPCVGTCGSYALCEVKNHVPLCTCPLGYTGDPFFSCREEPRTPPPRDKPCIPSPCGPNSQCREVNNQAVCSCLSNYIGTPPGCRPECVVNSECSDDNACINQKCADPCPNSCGSEASCKTINHTPICSCKNGFSGDPFVRCIAIRKLWFIFVHFSVLRVTKIGLPFSDPKRPRTRETHLHTIPLRTKRKVSINWWKPGMFLSRELHWRTSQLPTRMRFKLGMPKPAGVHQSEMPRPLPGLLWLRC